MSSGCLGVGASSAQVAVMPTADTRNSGYDATWERSTIRGYIGAIAHIALWMTQQRIARAQLDERLVSQFIDEHFPHWPCDYGKAMPNQKARGAHMTRAAADSVATTLHDLALCITSVEQNRFAVAVSFARVSKCWEVGSTASGASLVCACGVSPAGRWPPADSAWCLASANTAREARLPRTDRSCP